MPINKIWRRQRLTWNKGMYEKCNKNVLSYIMMQRNASVKKRMAFSTGNKQPTQKILE